MRERRRLCGRVARERDGARSNGSGGLCVARVRRRKTGRFRPARDGPVPPASPAQRDRRRPATATGRLPAATPGATQQPAKGRKATPIGERRIRLERCLASPRPATRVPSPADPFSKRKPARAQASHRRREQVLACERAGAGGRVMKRRSGIVRALGRPRTQRERGQRALKGPKTSREAPDRRSRVAMRRGTLCRRGGQTAGRAGRAKIDGSSPVVLCRETSIDSTGQGGRGRRTPKRTPRRPQ
jgi:hypothetical protein